MFITNPSLEWNLLRTKYLHPAGFKSVRLSRKSFCVRLISVECTSISTNGLVDLIDMFHDWNVPLKKI